MLSPSFSPADASELDSGVLTTNIKGVYYLPHKVFADDRGHYAELSRIPEIESATGEEFIIKQLNASLSKTNVARGFHAEQWNKLITVVSGTCFAALADIRPESESFGQVETFLFGPKEDQLSGCLYIPKGLANSFCVVEGPVLYLYAVDALYKDRDPAHDVAISLFDPDLNVDWPIPKNEMIISQRDQNSVNLRSKYPEKFS